MGEIIESRIKDEFSPRELIILHHHYDNGRDQNDKKIWIWKNANNEHITVLHGLENTAIIDTIINDGLIENYLNLSIQENEYDPGYSASHGFGYYI